MIITKIGCCLRPLGIVLNEQPHHDGLLLTSNFSIKHILCFHYDICSFIMNPYGRVQTFLVMIIHGAILYMKTPFPSYLCYLVSIHKWPFLPWLGDGIMQNLAASHASTVTSVMSL